MSIAVVTETPLLRRGAQACEWLIQEVPGQVGPCHLDEHPEARSWIIG
jgi:hypothetical protein